MGPGHQQAAARHAPLDTAGHVGLTAVAGVGLPHDRVVGLRTAPRRDVDALADLDGLDGLDAHERLGEHGIDLAVPVHVAAEPHWHAIAEHFDDAAERVARLGRGFDLLDHRLLGVGVEAAHLRGVDLLVVRVAMKPLATLNRPVLKTVDVETKEETVSFKERTDVTAVPAMGVVAETMTALVLAGEALRKFGGDSLGEVVRNRDAFLAGLD